MGTIPPAYHDQGLNSFITKSGRITFLWYVTAQFSIFRDLNPFYALLEIEEVLDIKIIKVLRTFLRKFPHIMIKKQGGCEMG